MSAPTWSFGVPPGTPRPETRHETRPEARYDTRHEPLPDTAPPPAGPDTLDALRAQIAGSWLTAGVDLLPEPYRAARRVGAARRGVAAGLVAVALLLGGATWQAHSTAAAAEAELADASARQSALIDQAAQLSEVPRVLDELSAVESSRSAAFATDVRWYSYLDGLSSSVPTGVWLTGFSWGSASGAAAVPPATDPATDPAADPDADPATDPAAAGGATVSTTGAVGTQGMLTVTGSTQDPALVASWLESAAATEGFADPTYSSLARSDVDGTPVYEFTATVAVTDAALSHRFDTATTADAAGTSTGAGS